MSRIDELIQQLCPNGVEYKPLGDIVNILDSQRKPISKEKRIPGKIPYYGANGIQGYVKDFIFDGIFLLIGEDGSVINKDGSPVLNWAEGKIWVNNHAHILTEKKDIASLRFIFFFLQTYDVTPVVRGTPPKMTQQSLREIMIPVPPLPVQEEIVRILDKFTALEAELEAELEARRKQYEFYRDQLLTFGDEVEWKPLGEIIISLRTGLNPRKNFNLNTPDASNYYVTVRELNGTSVVFHDKTDRINDDALRLINNRSKLEKGDLLFSGTGTIGRTAFISETPVNWNIKEGVYVIKPQQGEINSKYLLYILNTTKIRQQIANKVVGSPVSSIPMAELKKIRIPIPPLAGQERIVAILDKFDALVNDISSGLPAELEMRRKQYEYYRDRLLTFPEKKG